ncbi:RNA polymerase sigma-70 factor (sigma-E family) [Hamadaea flava]|uniref:SigE family RNA polymerase sigma factor n=1 Tax=Hamadaea flava TaxID=1742688 RepID=A0ABV8LYH9_9ACTN|nr:SigE family RNA polymerase sigma factor [Hamadaea flava]MCP2324653.1 RNA polymerase sigma-70 factor (sigma-E family) [Hamadaea flava]
MQLTTATADSRAHESRPSTPAGDFAEFVTARSARLLRVAYLLTRDWALAEDLLQSSLAKAWTAWRRIEGDPEPYVRRILVNTYTSWWRRRWHHERPIGELPEQAAPDEHRGYDDRDQLARALGRLPRQQRAVLVLRYYEDLSEAQIADVLGISPGTVKSHAAKAIAKLRVDPGLTGLQPDSEPPAGAARLAAVQDRIQHARQRRIVSIASVCAVVLALVLGYAINPAHNVVPAPIASATSRLINGFPEYALGNRVVATGTATDETTPTKLSWVASTSDFSVYMRCRASAATYIRVTFETTSGQLGQMGCDATPDGPRTGIGTAIAWPTENVMNAGVTAGAYVVMTVSLAITKRPAPADVVVDVAVGERMAWSDYPFPAKPKVLQELDSNRLDQSPKALELRPPAADASQTVKTVGLTWGTQYKIHISQRAPGILRLMVAGVEVMSCGNWSWETGGCGYTLDPKDPDLLAKLPALRPGEEFEIAIVPEHVSADWAAWIAPEE